jgi:hypothetical protein
LQGLDSSDKKMGPGPNISHALAKNEKLYKKMGPGPNISYAFLFEKEKIEAKMKKWGLSPFY